MWGKPRQANKEVEEKANSLVGLLVDGQDHEASVGMNLARISTQRVDVTFWDVGGSVRLRRVSDAGWGAGRGSLAASIAPASPRQGTDG